MQILKLPNPNAKCVPRCGAAGGGPSALQLCILYYTACSTRYKLVTRLLQVRTITFHVTLHENGSLCSWWVRIRTGAGKEPSSAEECLDLVHNSILIRRQQSLTSISLIW